MKTMKYKKNLVIGLTLGFTLAACDPSRNNSDTSARGHRPAYNNGQFGPNGLNPNDPHNKNLNVKGDDIVFPTDQNKQIPYDPNNYTHVVNPYAVAVKTGFGRSELLDYTDAGNDNIMERLKNLLGISQTTQANKAKSEEQLKKDLANSGWTEEKEKVQLSHSIQAAQEKLARSIVEASLIKSPGEQKYTLNVSINDIGRLSFNADVSDQISEKKYVKNLEMEADSSSEDAEAVTAQLSCVSRSSLDVCSTAVVKLRKAHDDVIAYIVFRSSPVNLYLGEYSSRLMLKPHGDPVIDRWVQFFAQVMNFQSIVGSTEGERPIAEIKSFAVANGIAGFELNINRMGYSPFVLSGPLEVSKRGAAMAVNSELSKHSLSGENEGSEDIINETLEYARLVHNNGRGMLQIGLQLHGLREAFSGDNGGIIMNDGAIKSMSRRNQPYNRGNQAFRTNSLRLQEKSSRALRITIVPIRSFGINEALLQ